LRTLGVGSVYWPGLRDGDWYSMTSKSGGGAAITPSLRNASGLSRVRYAWGVDSGGGTDVKICNAATGVAWTGWAGPPTAPTSGDGRPPTAPTSSGSSRTPATMSASGIGRRASIWMAARATALTPLSTPTAAAPTSSGRSSPLDRGEAGLPLELQRPRPAPCRTTHLHGYSISSWAWPQFLDGARLRRWLGRPVAFISSFAHYAGVLRVVAWAETFWSMSG
jgi:hypothetical protein